MNYNNEKWDYDKIVVPVSNTLGNCNAPCQIKFKNHINDKANKSWGDIQCCENSGLYYAEPNCDIGGPNALVAYQDYGDHGKWPQPPHPMECIFDRNEVSNLNQVYESVKKFGNNNPIQNAFCQTKVNTCPQEMIGGCSRYFSVNPDGDYCRKIFNDQTDAQKDIAIANYCSRNDTVDCKCANRSNDPDYVKLKQGNPFPDSCWYIPCANAQRYLVPSEFKHNPNCPENICQIVFDISQAHDVNIDHLKADINCDFGGGKYPNHSPYLWYYVIGYILAGILLIIYASK